MARRIEDAWGDRCWRGVRLEGDVLRWASNGREPFDDMLRHWLSRGMITEVQREATNAARKISSEIAMREYAEARARRTPEQIAEERFEMMAAFGPGVEVVNVITGERTTT